MFQLVNFSVDRVSGHTDVLVLVSNEADSRPHHFLTEASAIQWITALRKEILLSKVEKFIAHKKNIIESGEGRQSAVRLNSLKRCGDFLQWACEPTISLKDICIYALKIRNDFDNILPHERNNSYDSSCNNLTKIMVFCKEQHQFNLTVTAKI